MCGKKKLGQIIGGGGGVMPTTAKRWVFFFIHVLQVLSRWRRIADDPSLDQMYKECLAKLQNWIDFFLTFFCILTNHCQDGFPKWRLEFMSSLEKLVSFGLWSICRVGFVCKYSVNGKSGPFSIDICSTRRFFDRSGRLLILDVICPETLPTFRWYCGRL